MTNKVYNFLIVSFLTFGSYNLPGCDVFPREGASSTTGNQQEQICGDCQISGNEECDICNDDGWAGYSFCTDQKWPVGGDFGPCTVVWYQMPQLDCSISWMNALECDQQEADLLCKIWTRSEKAKAIAGSWSIEKYHADKSILTQIEIPGKLGNKLTQLPKIDYTGEIWTYDMNPHNESFPVLIVQECFFEE